jgi:hypothetical protein
MSVTAVRQVREILDELLATPLAKLNEKGTRERLRQLQVSLPVVQAFAERTGKLLDGLDGMGRGRAAVAPASADERPARPRGRRSRDGFRPTAFLLEAVQGSGPKGVSPKELIAMVEAAAPGRHARPANLVSPLLNRLKKRGLVRNRGGRWYAR